MTPDPPIRPRLLAVIGGSDGQRYSARVRSFISPRRPVRARRLRRTHRGAGFTFALGEQSFADDAVVVSGTVTSATPAQVQSTLVGSYLGDSIRVITPDVAEIEIVFSDNTIINGPGTDLVIFELSGSGRPVGYADATEKFEVSVLNASGFSPFVQVVPVNTGFLDPQDATLSAYVVQIDLASFGFAADQITQRVRIRLVDNLAGSRSADPTAFGALNSAPIPEPCTGLLFTSGLLAHTLARRHSHQRSWRSRSCVERKKY